MELFSTKSVTGFAAGVLVSSLIGNAILLNKPNTVDELLLADYQAKLIADMAINQAECTPDNEVIHCNSELNVAHIKYGNKAISGTNNDDKMYLRFLDTFKERLELRGYAWSLMGASEGNLLIKLIKLDKV